MFTLETIKAKHGDCLILRWGTKTKPGIALIDGGPPGVYRKFLKDRLAELAEELEVEVIPFDLTMVSHIDEDHIGGILDLAKDIEDQNATAKISTLWHNSLEGLLDHDFSGTGGTAALASVGTAFRGMTSGAAKEVLASVPQGQKLHMFVRRQGIEDSLNLPFKKIPGSTQRLVIARDEPAPFGDLKLQVVAPAAGEIEELRKEWVKRRNASITAGFDDDSPFNLSSIVALATYKKKTMLLTGDARGDVILRGLKDAKLLDKKGRLHVNLFKFPHHGSPNNVTQEFLEKVTADVYVISGDGVKFPNPNPEAMTWLADARGDDDYVVYCPYELDHMRETFGDKLITPDEGSVSVTAVLS